MQSIRVRTTQNVFIQYPVASVGDRILAYIIDRLILVFYSVAVSALFINLEVEIYWVWLMVLGTPWLIYNLAFEIFMNGQSPGKRTLNIKVVRLDGTSPTLGGYLLRWIFSFVDFYFLGGVIAVILVAAGGRGQRLGDMVAGTSVIKQVEQKEVTAQEIFVMADAAYQPVFAQAIALNEKDIDLIQQALEVNRDLGNAQPMLAVTEKVKSQLGIQSDLPPVKLLYTLIKDFNHLTSR
ncbi:MAG: RDD family protein [Cyclobacteriaceae bacterium]|nr:RDD family protein [Cyclobacteriaceae bacterium]